MSFIVVLNDGETYTNIQGCWIYEVTNEEGFDNLADGEIKLAREQGFIRPVEPVNMITD